MIEALDGNVATDLRTGGPDFGDALDILRLARTRIRRENHQSLLDSLAGDLHDGAVQHLFAAELDVADLLARSDLDPEVSGLVHSIARRLTDSSRQLRAVLQDMKHGERTDPSDLPLSEAIHECVESFVRRNPISIDVEIRGTDTDIGAQQRRTALRLVREGLTNIDKHACASQAMVTVYRSRQWFTVDLDDDGCGDPVQIRCRMAQSSTKSFGLPSLAAQATTAGGRMWVSDAPTLGGVRVSLALPSRTVA